MVYGICGCMDSGLRKNRNPLSTIILVSHYYGDLLDVYWFSLHGFFYREARGVLSQMHFNSALGASLVFET